MSGRNATIESSKYYPLCTPSDADDVALYEGRYPRISVSAGTLVVHDLSGATQPFADGDLPATVIVPMFVKRVLATGTSATVRLWY